MLFTIGNFLNRAAGGSVYEAGFLYEFPTRVVVTDLISFLLF